MHKWPPKINPGSPTRWFGASALITQPGFQCCFIYIYHNYARFLAVRYVIFRSFTEMRSWTQKFRLGLVGLRPTMMPVGGRLQGSLEAYVPPS